jgi:hypothetical protein
MQPPAIDRTRLYGTAEIATIFGVDRAQPYRWVRRSASGVRSPMIGRLPAASKNPLLVRGDVLLAFWKWRWAHSNRPHPGVIAIARSGNAKLGRAAATIVARQSCPASCPYKGSGCYAEHDNTRTHWDRISAGSGSADALALAGREASAIDRLRGDRDLRLHVAGDSPTEEGTRLIAAACARYVGRGRAIGLEVKVWAYTHAWREVTRAAWGCVSVLASCETAADATLARARGYAVALTVPEFEAERAYDAAGVKIVPCPQQTRGASCTDCRLCFGDERLRDRSLAIGFALHGAGIRKARRALADTRTPLPMAG